MKELIEKELIELIESFNSIQYEFPNYYNEIVLGVNKTAKQLIEECNNSDLVDEQSNDKSIRRKLLLSNDIRKRNYFTISSKDSFSEMPTIIRDDSWGESIIYFPLNDHSRSFLKKGDVLFCYRQGQFSDLNEGLNQRGIYAIGIAGSDPVELFPNEEKHNKWGVLVCFPIKLPNHLELRNIQMHPSTIDLTPYNGNRNDALQHIPNEKHYLTLLNMLYSRNNEIQDCFIEFFEDIKFENIDLPSSLFSKYYQNPHKGKLQIDSKSNLIQESFTEWFHKDENYKKSYDGLVNVKVLNFWDKVFFDSEVFNIDCDKIEDSIIRIEKKISDKNNIEWKSYSEASSKGAPEAVMGKNNYIKFLNEFLNIEQNIENIRNSKYHLAVPTPTISLQNEKNISSINQTEFDINSFLNNIVKAGLLFSNQIIQRFVASLCTKPFVICSGLSGSGKTKLAQSFVHWICESGEQYKIIPVGADWTNREPLLGYPNGLNQKSYIIPESGSLQLILEASKKKNQNKPYFLILDEMNLSHVERYFADFLSIMESKEKLKLYSGDNRYSITTEESRPDDKYFVPQEIEWPNNLFIIGTVNIDETTYMFSPKVLDRANVIEFRITQAEMENFFSNRKEIDMNEFFLEKDEKKGGNGQNMAESFLRLAQDKSIEQLNETRSEKNVLNEFFNELQKVGCEFGYRGASEIELLLIKLGIHGFTGNDGNPLDNNAKIDIAIMQKLLPKLHGSRKKLVGPLETIAGLCISRAKNSQPNEQNKLKSSYQQFISENRDSQKWGIIYPISFEKIERMLNNVIENGFTSYAEA